VSESIKFIVLHDKWLHQVDQIDDDGTIWYQHLGFLCKVNVSMPYVDLYDLDELLDFKSEYQDLQERNFEV
jgi:hypothetical protein